MVNTTVKDQPEGVPEDHFLLIPGADGVGKDVDLGKDVLSNNGALVEDTLRTRIGKADWLFVLAGGGGGTGATLTLTIASNSPTTLVVGSAGSGYSVGDTITFATSLVGGSADIVYTILVGDTFGTSTQGSTDFTLHKSNETNLILSILGYAGLIIKDPNIVTAVTQLASADAQTKRQQ